MKKILFIGGTSGGGVATINNEVYKIATGSDKIKNKLIDTTKSFRQTNKLFAYLHLYFQLVVEIFKFKPDIVYLQIAQTGYLHQSIFLLIAKLFGKKTIAHFHAKPNLKTTSSPFQFRSIINSKRYIDKMIVLTDACKNSLLDNGYKKEIHVILNFIDSNELPDIVKPIIEKDSLLYIGRMHEQKGIFEILEISKHFENEHFIFIGDFSDKETETKFTEAIKSCNNCTYLGAIYDNSKYNYINNSKFFIFPTLWKGEVFPLSIIESMLLGCIPFVNPIGSINEIINHGENGFNIKANDVAGTIKLINEILTNGDSYMQNISDNAIKWAKEKYTSNAVRDHLIRTMVEK
jgi:glycosyltransferase involved in cell wall biosynthesis